MLNSSSALFSPYSDFLAHTLACPESVQVDALNLPSCTVRLIGLGAIKVTPHKPSSDGLILSAGIHGNETAPIELLNRLVDKIVNRKLIVTRPVLILFGHPFAMRNQERFLDVNLNRLFSGEHRKQTYQGTTEATLAAEIENWCRQFHQLHDCVLHLDLHTAIRESQIERFALKPFTENKDKHKNSSAPSSSSLPLLNAMGVRALVYQHRKSTTFSSFTANEFQCESYTVELGRVRKFGENELAHYDDTYNALEYLVCETPPSDNDAPESISNIDEYEVCTELLVDADDFSLHIEENTPNFTSFERNDLVSSSSASTYKVKHAFEYLIFPNAKVPMGQRAGLMLKRIDRR